MREIEKGERRRSPFAYPRISEWVAYAFAAAFSFATSAMTASDTFFGTGS
jgi:hypothetical protein